MDKQIFFDELKKINIELTPKQIRQFELYFETLIEWNEKMNLTAITDEAEVYEKHFYDCLLSIKMYDFTNQNICDVGAGAGFPSVPLKIVFPDLKITIVDSLNKRITFLNHLFKILELDNVQAIGARAEEFALDHREEYDLVMARAVARLNILSELCLPLVKIDGYFLALKGKLGYEELVESKKGISILGGEVAKVSEHHLYQAKDIRYLILIKKISKTLQKYPRMYSKIKKKPL